MTDSVINHQFAQIFATLEDIKNGINTLSNIRDDTDKAFSNLLNSGAFEGAAASQVQVVRQQQSQTTEEHIATLTQIYQQAVQQQYDTMHLDHQLAGGIPT